MYQTKGTSHGNFFEFCSNPCPSLPSVATDERKQFQYRNVVLHSKTVPLFLEFNWCKDTFGKLFKKVTNSVS